jgi:hypothetical protein
LSTLRRIRMENVLAFSLILILNLVENWPDNNSFRTKKQLSCLVLITGHSICWTEKYFYLSRYFVKAHRYRISISSDMMYFLKTSVNSHCG